MQINHNIRAMVTQQALYLNDNSMTKSLEKLSTGLRINRAQDDAAGLAMSEQMRTQIRGLGKAKRNAQDGQAALQIAEGALGEITNMMQRQKELAVQSANDTLTSTERMYLNDEFQALTKEIDRIAKNTDYNGKNVLLFDVDPNKSFGATKLDPYNKEISFLETANVIYKYFGQDLKGGFAALTVSYGAKTGADAETGAGKINNVISAINAVLASYAPAGIITDSNIKDVLEAFKAAGRAGDVDLGNDLLHTNTVSYMSGIFGGDGSTTISYAGGRTFTTTDGAALLAALYAAGVSTVSYSVVSGSAALLATLNAAGVNTVSYSVVSGSGSAALADSEKTASNMKTLQSVNDFLRAVDDALTAYDSANLGEFIIKDGATKSAQDTFVHLATSDIESVSAVFTGNATATGIGSLDRIISQLNNAFGNSGVTIDTTTVTLTGGIPVAGGTAITVTFASTSVNTAALTQAQQAAMWSSLGAIFGTNASAQMQDDVKAFLQVDASKIANGAIKDQVLTWQKAIGEFKDAYKVYAEADISTGSAASEILHVGPNYSTGLGGGASNQIRVNYTAVDVKGLGLEAQTIDSREGAQRAIDKLQETIKVISGNRATIGTYINRLDYTVNNIASMEYNIQDAESRIRDTDFATETTNFTRNQIMVQASTSMLAQANSLPQAVLGLLG